MFSAPSGDCAHPAESGLVLNLPSPAFAVALRPIDACYFGGPVMSELGASLLTGGRPPFPTGADFLRLPCRRVPLAGGAASDVQPERFFPGSPFCDPLSGSPVFRVLTCLFTGPHTAECHGTSCRSGQALFCARFTFDVWTSTAHSMCLSSVICHQSVEGRSGGTFGCRCGKQSQYLGVVG